MTVQLCTYPPVHIPPRLSLMPHLSTPFARAGWSVGVALGPVALYPCSLRTVHTTVQSPFADHGVALPHAMHQNAMLCQ